ncbi:MAG: hypothetical protein DMF22_06175 [Verrucomicrobia bacterium]|nr:MAG: hypothetical protein DMF22_06175 [Verrucomicrobiota bacterium]
MGVARSSGLTRLCGAAGGGKYPSRGIIEIERNKKTYRRGLLELHRLGLLNRSPAFWAPSFGFRN